VKSSKGKKALKMIGGLALVGTAAAIVALTQTTNSGSSGNMDLLTSHTFLQEDNNKNEDQ
jgi:hypothetical protein